MFDPVKGPAGGALEPMIKPQEGLKHGQGSSFTEVLKDSIDKVNRLQNEADKAIDGLAKGEARNIHDAMIAIEKANISFNMMLQVRNKILAAYEEIMRTQV